MAGIPSVGVPATITTTTVATSGTGRTATVQLSRAPNVAVGANIIISQVTPVAYNGTFTATAVSNTAPYSVSYASTATGSMTKAGTFSTTLGVNNQGGGSKVYTNTANTTAATTETVTLTQSGAATQIVKYYATLTLDAALNVGIGSTISVTGITPSGYRTSSIAPVVTGVVTGVSDVYPYSVSYEVLSALPTQNKLTDTAGFVKVTGTQFDSGDFGMVGTSGGLLGNNSQANVKTFYQNAQSAALAAKRDQIFDGLDPELPLPLAILKAIGFTLTQAANVAVTTVVEVLDHVGNWISQAIDAGGKIIGDIITAVVDGAGNAVRDLIDMLHYVLSGDGLAKDFGNLLSGNRDKTVNQLGKAAEEVKTTVYLTDIESGTTTDFFNEVRVLPSWVGGKNDDVNLPHSFISGTSTTVATSPSTLGLDGRLVLIPVIAGQNRTWSAVKFGVAQMTSGAKVPGSQTFGSGNPAGEYLTSASTTTVGSTKVATIGLTRASYVDVGDTITVSGFPTSWAGYNGTWTVSAKSDVSPYSVSYVVPALLPIATPTTQTTTATTTSITTSGTGTAARVTLTLNASLGVAVGDTILVSGVTPTAYNGTYTVTARSNTSPFSVSYASTATGSMTVAGTAGTDPVLTTPAPYAAPYVTTPSAVLMGVYDVDETTGAATKVIDLGNIRSKINVGDNAQRNLQVISLPSPKTVQMGEIYYIGILQIGDAGLTPAGSIALSYAPSSVIPYTFNTGQFPKRVCLYRNDGTFGVLPASFTDSQLSGSSSSFWGAFGDVSPSTVPPTVTFADSFTTGTNGVGAGATIDSQKWLTRYGSGLKVASMPGGELRATANSTTGTSMHTYRFKTNYLKQNNQCTFVTQTEVTGQLGRGGILLSLRGDGVGKFIYLRLVIETAFLSWQIRAGIYTSTSFTAVGSEFSGGVLRKEVITNTGLVPANGNTWKFIADGYSYVGYRNTGSGFTEHIRWDDTGFAFAGSGPSNSNFKEVGIGAYYVAEYSCVDNWSAWDASS
jgi:hypothetical protein